MCCPPGEPPRCTNDLWVGKYLKTVTYQEVLDELSSAALGRLWGRAARVELFQGWTWNSHARSGDVRTRSTPAPR